MPRQLFFSLLLRCLTYAFLVLMLLLRWFDDSLAAIYTRPVAALAGPLAMLFCVAWPWFVHQKWLRPPVFQRRVETVHSIEALLLGTLLAPLGLPWIASLCLFGVMVAAALALCGVRVGVICATAYLTPTWVWLVLQPSSTATLATVGAADFSLLSLAALGMLIIFVLLLGYSAFTEMSQARSGQQVEHQVNQRLGRYLPAPVVARVRSQSDPAGLLSRERCWLSVAFVDLVGYTELSRRLAAEDAADLLNDYLATLDTLARGCAGVLCNSAGDGALLYWGGGGFESTERIRLLSHCVEFAQQLPVAITKLDQRWQRLGCVAPLSVRAGIASGVCTLGDWGGGCTESRLEFSVVGHPVNLAARLQQAARATRVLVAADSVALLANALPGVVPFGPAQPLELKGLGSVTGYELLS